MFILTSNLGSIRWYLARCAAGESAVLRWRPWPLIGEAIDAVKFHDAMDAVDFADQCFGNRGGIEITQVEPPKEAA